MALSGPTLFAPLLRHAVGLVRQAPRAGLKYYVLLILTDGCIHDMQVLLLFSGFGHDARRPAFVYWLWPRCLPPCLCLLALVTMLADLQPNRLHHLERVPGGWHAMACVDGHLEFA
eukprot:197754-Chlamydomonas_euryale.AAC.2